MTPRRPARVSWRRSAALHLVGGLVLLHTATSLRAAPPTGPAAAPVPIGMPWPNGVSAGPTSRSDDANTGRRLVNNTWVDADLREVLRDISQQTGVTIVADQTVQGVVSLFARDMMLEECLERLCASGGYTCLKVKDYYVIGSAEPGTAMFRKTSELRRIKLRYCSSDQLKAMLPASMATYVTFDRTNDAVFVAAPEAAAERVLAAITLIDVPNQQLAVEAIVFELTEAGSRQLGLDWRFKEGKIAVAGSNLVGTITYDAAADVATYIDVTLRAIVQEQKGRVLANPRILVMNGREAEIFVGQEKYFSLLTGQAINPYFRLESIKAGVMLKVTPHVGDQGQIVLDLEPEVSDVASDWTRTQENGVDPVTLAPALPVVTRRKAKTSVSIRDGQTVVLGGLLREQHRKMIEKVPVLGDWPVLGAGFRKVRELKEQQEVVILITTHLVESANACETKPITRLQQRYRSPLDTICLPNSGDARCVQRR